MQTGQQLEAHQGLRVAVVVAELNWVAIELQRVLTLLQVPEHSLQAAALAHLLRGTELCFARSAILLKGKVYGPAPGGGNPAPGGGNPAPGGGNPPESAISMRAVQT